MSGHAVPVAHSAAAEPQLCVWLAGPGARSFFDADAQTPEDRLRWQQLSSARRREEWEVSRALLAHVRGRTRQLSLSHSAGHAAVAAGSGAVSLGVDVEQVRERDFLRLAKFAFAAGEHAQLEALAPRARAERFYILWTLKEAFAKALGLSVLQSVSRCTFLRHRDEWRAAVPAPGAWVARVFRPRPSLVLSVVALLPERATTSRACRLVETKEWPAVETPSWPTLASLTSRCALASLDPHTGGGEA